MLLLVTGLAVGWALPTLTAPGDDSADAGFARDMATHHAQAVEMGMFAFQRASDAEVRNMGYDIATTQQYQIGMMQAWLTEWGLSFSAPHGPMAWMPDGQRAMSDDGRMPGMASDSEIAKLKTLTGKDFDVSFCQLMLRHHLGGVHMAEEALRLAKDRRVLDLAERIKAGQRTEITILNQRLDEFGAKPLQ